MKKAIMYGGGNIGRGFIGKVFAESGYEVVFLDIILCENQLEADKLMRGWIYEYLTDEQKAWADNNLGLIEASIGRMVPPLTPEMREQDPLLICVEPYCDLPVDKPSSEDDCSSCSILSSSPTLSDPSGVSGDGVQPPVILSVLSLIAPVIASTAG